MTAMPTMQDAAVPLYGTDDERYEAVRARNREADGEFYFAVRTTGVYCRPSCGARLPNRENVTFHATRAEAERAGFRPCKRCKPDKLALADDRARMVAAACRTIDAAETAPRLEALAESAGLSPFHFHRIFKEITGLTPKAYGAAARARRVRADLGRGAAVTETIYAAGFNAPSRFYESADGMLGMTPSAYRDGGRGVEIRFAVGESSIGAILVAATARGVCRVEIGEDPQALIGGLERAFPKATLIGGDQSFEATVAAVVGFVEAPRAGLELPVDVGGTVFQERVWQALRQIPPGATLSYSEVAARIGTPKAVRAVGAACGANPVALVIPCHRVIRSDGALSGYRWGIERKRTLLERERQA